MYIHVWSFGTCPAGYLVIFGVHLENGPVLSQMNHIPPGSLGRFFYWVGGSRNIIEYLYNYIHIYTNLYCTKHFSHWVSLSVSFNPLNPKLCQEVYPTLLPSYPHGGWFQRAWPRFHGPSPTGAPQLGIAAPRPARDLGSHLPACSGITRSQLLRPLQAIFRHGWEWSIRGNWGETWLKNPWVEVFAEIWVWLSHVALKSSNGMIPLQVRKVRRFPRGYQNMGSWPKKMTLWPSRIGISPAKRCEYHRQDCGLEPCFFMFFLHIGGLDRHVSALQTASRNCTVTRS